MTTIVYRQLKRSLDLKHLFSYNFELQINKNDYYRLGWTNYIVISKTFETVHGNNKIILIVEKI
jgi:hypothetical protein